MDQERDIQDYITPPSPPPRTLARLSPPPEVVADNEDHLSGPGVAGINCFFRGPGSGSVCSR